MFQLNKRSLNQFLNDFKEKVRKTKKIPVEKKVTIGTILESTTWLLDDHLTKNNIMGHFWAFDSSSKENKYIVNYKDKLDKDKAIITKNYKHPYDFVIHLSVKYHQNKREIAFDTILHEVAHAIQFFCDGVHSHNKNWKTYHRMLLETDKE